MTKRYNKYKVLDLWNHALSVSKLFSICMQNANTHIIVDASKEASMTEVELWQDPAEFERVMNEAIAHNEQNGNRVDIITGNYKLIPEETSQIDITLDGLKQVETYKEARRLAELCGELPPQPTYTRGPYSVLLQQHFFDNVQIWPTYFLVWNGTKVAAPALEGISNFSKHRLDALFFLKNRVAKHHRLLLLDEIQKRGLIDNDQNRFTLIDPHAECDKIMEEIGATTYSHGRHIYDSEEELQGDIYAGPPKGYINCLIDVVSETSLTTHFRTEKCVWPIVYQKLFMIHGPRYINQNLKKYGFELYDEVIDYSFDSIASPRKRTEALAAELKRLNDLDLNLDVTRRLCKSKIEHNLKNYLELCFHDPYIPQIVKDLGNNEKVISQQAAHSPLVNPMTGSWKTFVDRDGGNGVIMDIVRRHPYLQQIMGKLK